MADNLDLINRARAAFPHITPAIPDFNALDDKGGDSFTAIRDTASILSMTNDLIPPLYQRADATDERVLEWVDALVGLAKPNQFSRVPYLKGGPSLLLLGATGVGKTHQAYGALRRLSIVGIGCGPVAASITDVFAKMRPRPGVDSEAVFEAYASAPLAFIDDLGAAKVTEWTEEVTYRLVNHRYEHQLPTIFTSNAAPKDLGERVGERVASRLMEMAQRVAIKGDDRRRQGRAA
ncbi:ATP-binding protein [Nocardiopsis sp. NPDC007018]|uniref:ATP-binding protein n=1 Tax=Nocardiopsis sp. NPDC007018 TaxID=3155721 RepID=UPI0033DE565C